LSAIIAKDEKASVSVKTAVTSPVFCGVGRGRDVLRYCPTQADKVIDAKAMIIVIWIFLNERFGIYDHSFIWNKTKRNALFLLKTLLFNK